MEDMLKSTMRERGRAPLRPAAPPAGRHLLATGHAPPKPTYNGYKRPRRRRSSAPKLPRPPPPLLAPHSAAAAAISARRRRFTSPCSLAAPRAEVSWGIEPHAPPSPFPPPPGHRLRPGRPNRAAAGAPPPLPCSASRGGGRKGVLPITPSVPFYLIKSSPTLCFLSNKTLPFMVITNKAPTI